MGNGARGEAEMAALDELRARFRAAYRGALPPDDALRLVESGDDPVRTAEEAAYRRDADPDAVERLRALREAMLAPAPPGDEPSDPAPPAPSRAPHSGPGRTAAAVGAALVLGALIGAVATRATAPEATSDSTAAPSAQQEVQARVLDSRGAFTAQDYYRLYPDDLPIDWGGASTGRGFRALVGTATLELHPSPASSRLLVVPTCPVADGRFRWTLLAASGAAVAAGDGRCGAFTPVEAAIPSRLRGRDLRLQVGADGRVPYSVAVFER